MESKNLITCFEKFHKAFRELSQSQRNTPISIRTTWGATIQFYAMKRQVYQFLSQNKGAVVISTEISVKNVFFEIRLDDIFSILSLRYGPNHISIGTILVTENPGKVLQAIRGSHDISVRLYGRRNTFLSFFVKSSWGTSKLDSKSTLI